MHTSHASFMIEKSRLKLLHSPPTLQAVLLLLSDCTFSVVNGVSHVCVILLQKWCLFSSVGTHSDAAAPLHTRPEMRMARPFTEAYFYIMFQNGSKNITSSIFVRLYYYSFSSQNSSLSTIHVFQKSSAFSLISYFRNLFAFRS